MNRICEIDGCANVTTSKGKYNGETIYRKKCSKHHGEYNTPNYKKRKETNFSYRTIVMELLGGKCILCYSIKGLQIHHIVSISSGGRHTIKNLQLLCSLCHHKIHSQITGPYFIKTQEDIYGAVFNIARSLGTLFEDMDR